MYGKGQDIACCAIPIVFLSSCIVIPIEIGGEEPFTDDQLAFIESGKSTKAEIASAMSDFPIETDEDEVRIGIAPQKF
jgi:hypothetical protein